MVNNFLFCVCVCVLQVTWRANILGLTNSINTIILAQVATVGPSSMSTRPFQDVCPVGATPVSP